MKLNLLPTTVSRGSQTRNALIASIFLVIGGVALALFLYTSSESAKALAIANANVYEAQAAEAVAVSKKADDIIVQAAAIIRNIELSNAMQAHTDVYPKLYGDIKPYIPSFFRVTAMSAAPNGAESCTVTLTGVIDSYQQYADLMLALLRIPGEPKTVTRTGYQINDPIIPPVTDADQTGRPRLPGDPPVPDDPLQRLENRINSGGVSGYLAAGGFGSGEPTTKTTMPGQSLITVNIVLPRNIQTPEPRATLSTALPTSNAGGTVPSTTGANGGGASSFGTPPPPTGGATPKAN